MQRVLQSYCSSGVAAKTTLPSLAALAILHVGRTRAAPSTPRGAGLIHVYCASMAEAHEQRRPWPRKSRGGAALSAVSVQWSRFPGIIPILIMVSIHSDYALGAIPG